MRFFFVSFTKFSLPVIRQQLASSLLTILQTSEYGLSNACFVFSLLLYSSYQDFADLMVFFFKRPNYVCLCAYTIWTCAAVGKTLKIGLKSIKIIKWLAGTASTCSILFCPSHGCSRQFWTQSKLDNASFSGKRFTLSASFTFTTITDNLGKCTFKHGNLRQLDPFTNLAKGWTSQSIICQRSFKQLPLAISYKKF